MGRCLLILGQDVMYNFRCWRSNFNCGVLCVGTSVRFIDTIKFNQSRQLTSSRELRLTVLLTTKSFCLGFICFFRLIFLFTMHLFKLYSDCFQGCRVVVNLIRLVWRGDNFYLTK